MIGIIIIAHANIASEMKTAVQHVLGSQPLFEAIDVPNSDDTAMVHADLAARLQQCDTGQGVLIFADMFGGTPCNIALGVMKKGHYEVVSGFSLPAIIKAVSIRKNIPDVHILAEQSVQAGKHYIHQTSVFDVTGSHSEHA